MKEKSKGLKESKQAPQLSLKEKRKLKKEKKNRWNFVELAGGVGARQVLGVMWQSRKKGLRSGSGN